MSNRGSAARGPDSWRKPPGRNKISLVVSLSALILAVAGLALSPLALGWLGRVRQDWVTLGNIGQAYGGISAILSGLALLGIVSSLRVQRRQHFLDRVTFLRQRQADLYAIVRESPYDYWPAFGGAVESSTAVRQHTFRIEVLQYMIAGFENGLFPERNLRAEILAGFFRYEVNRRHWADAREYVLLGGINRARRRFVEIADEELTKAELGGKGLSLPEQGCSRPRWLIPSLLTLVAAGVVLRRSKAVEECR